MNRAARLSNCGEYRYELTRQWSSAPVMTVVGLNPSTADHTEDDNTIRRCIYFAKAAGCGGLLMLNVYALRSTDPAALATHADPVGPDNESTLQHYADARAKLDDVRPELVGPVVLAWGAANIDRSRLAFMHLYFWHAHALEVTATGAPRHPLYLSNELENGAPRLPVLFDWDAYKW